MEKQFLFIQDQNSIIAALAYGIIFLVLLTTGLLLFFHYSRRKIIQKELEKAALKLEHQKTILQATIATQEEERKRIAQDLHDAISARLNVVSLTTNLLLDDDTINEEQKVSLEHILGVTTTTLESSRKIAHDLLPPILDKFGLKVALEELFDDFIKSQQLQIKHDIDELEFLSKTNNLHVFRIAQELINNAVRHGDASRMNIQLKKEGENRFIFTCKDNGNGFDVKKVRKQSGIGLQNINSRAAILECDLHIESEIDKGSLFTIQSKK
ncbi:ATP-binding protein [uncultured Dokdonia sp.]|uniref:sensor histidine kinase n=1 Tax=uncultured Dokdonia sp. TaxID=575653 RepID=UPI0026393892|nr:ATP-binding protein [uncultured Dokdonia sp.]